MSHVIVFKDEALVEYLDAYDWYEKERSGLGKTFQSVIDAKLKFISENPDLYYQPKNKFHQAVVLEFPFVIVYKIKPVQKIIFISSIFHTSRNPKKKYRR